MKKFVSLSDIHFPYEDRAALDVVEKFLLDFRPDVLYFNGDVFDCPQISSYAKRRGEVNSTTSLQDHLDHGILGMGNLIDAAGPTQICFAQGNHEDRFERYLGTKAPELASLRVLDVPTMLGLKNIDTRPYGEGYWITDSLFLYHGTRIGSNWTAREREDVGASTITGHQHRQGVTYHRDRARQYKSIGQGCLCKMNPPYMQKPPNWQQGFVHGYLWGQDKFRVIEDEVLKSHDGTTWTAPEGVRYEARLSDD